jgi:hypothetical protein
MPAKSEAQRRFIYGVKGAAFAKAHHFDNAGPLPAHVKKGKAMKKPKEEMGEKYPDNEMAEKKPKKKGKKGKKESKGGGKGMHNNCSYS